MFERFSYFLLLRVHEPVIDHHLKRTDGSLGRREICRASVFCDCRCGIMGKISGYKLKEVVYTLSPFEQKIMSTFWSQFAYKTKKRISENWVNAATLVCPIAGTYMYAVSYVEKEKLHHRY